MLCFVILQAETVHELNEEIGKLLAKAEQLGAEGNVDEAQLILQEVEKVRSRKRDAEVRGCFPHNAYSLHLTHPDHKPGPCSSGHTLAKTFCNGKL